MDGARAPVIQTAHHNVRAGGRPFPARLPRSAASEVLFVRRVSPFANVRDTSDEELAGLLGEARKLMRQNLGGGPRTTRRRFGSSRLWVYGRSGKPCFQCGSAVRMRRQGDAGRSTYYCPRCQAGPMP